MNFNFSGFDHEPHTPPGTHTELYDILELKPTATTAEIKAAYKILAKKYHPDKNKSPEAEDMFKKISNAKEILSNEEKRKNYDAYGLEGANAEDNPFAHIFKSFGGGGGMNNKPRKKLFQHVHNLSLRDLMTKDSIDMTFDREIKCSDCDGTGFEDMTHHWCPECRGQGSVMKTVRQGPVIQQMQMICSKCRGRKFDVDFLHLGCNRNNCSGGKVKVEEHIHVQLPINILKKNNVLVEGKGPWIDGEYIDLLVVFLIAMEKGYSMTNDKKLMYTMNINLTEMICGLRRVIDHPSGKKIMIVVDKGMVISHRSVYKLDLIGLYNDSMYLNFDIHFPEKISMPKRGVLMSFEHLEMALGPRSEPNARDDGDIDPELIFNLGTVDKGEDNVNQSETYDEDDEPDISQGHQHPQCSQQ